MIYYSGFCAEGASLVPQLRQQGFDQQILGADASDDSQCPVGGGEAFDEYVFTGFGEPRGSSVGAAATRATEFASFFDVVFPDASDFNGFTLAGADSLNVLVEAIQNADEPSDPDEVLTALQNLEGYAGVSGEITYAGTDGTPADRTMGFFRYSVPGEDGSEWSSQSLFGRRHRRRRRLTLSRRRRTAAVHAAALATVEGETPGRPPGRAGHDRPSRSRVALATDSAVAPRAPRGAYLATTPKRSAPYRSPHPMVGRRRGRRRRARPHRLSRVTSPSTADLAFFVGAVLAVRRSSAASTP
ncbi:MAG: hypothetical protein U5J97_01995 [Trueperaceae bacterium]|nr:hypothetical protein [Trueperaceae bacterium]